MKNLQKWLVAVLSVVTLVSTASSTLAFDAKPAPVTITYAVNGDTVTLTAVTPKAGSTFGDSWSGGATKVETTLNADGYYVSTATFSSATEGEFSISYHITMSAGASNVTWTGDATTSITVGGPNGTIPPRAGGAGTNI